MSRLPQRAGILGAYQWRRGREAPRDGLFRTLLHDIGDSILGTQFPANVRDQAITVAFDYFNTAAAVPVGVVFRIGSTVATDSVFSVELSGSDLVVVAGSSSATPNDRVNTAFAIFPAAAEFDPDKALSIVVSVNPGTGEVRVWLDGELVGRAQAVNNNFGAGGVWAGGSDGLGLPALASGQVIPNLSFFTNQRPRQFEVGGTP